MSKPKLEDYYHAMHWFDLVFQAMPYLINTVGLVVDGDSTVDDMIEIRNKIVEKHKMIIEKCMTEYPDITVDEMVKGIHDVSDKFMAMDGNADAQFAYAEKYGKSQI